MTDINNSVNYKPCRKKQFDAWLCRPDIGTIVLDPYNQAMGAEFFKRCKCRDNFMTPETVEKYRVNTNIAAIMDKLIASGQLSRVSQPDEVVVCGTLGEMYIMKADYALKRYLAFSGSTYVNLNAIPEFKSGVFDWRRVRATVGGSALTTMACFVPARETMIFGGLQVNNPSQHHGKGDFILAVRLPNGQPDMNNRWLVNGLIFANTYNNQGWQDVISISRGGFADEKPPTLIAVTEEVENNIDLLGVCKSVFTLPGITFESSKDLCVASVGTFKLAFQYKSGIIRISKPNGTALIVKGKNKAEFVVALKKNELCYALMCRAITALMLKAGYISSEPNWKYVTCNPSIAYAFLNTLSRIAKKYKIKFEDMGTDYEIFHFTYNCDICVIDSVLTDYEGEKDCEVNVYGWTYASSDYCMDEDDSPYEHGAGIHITDNQLLEFETAFTDVYRVLLTTGDDQSTSMQWFDQAISEIECNGCVLSSELKNFMRKRFKSLDNRKAWSRLLRLFLWSSTEFEGTAIGHDDYDYVIQISETQDGVVTQARVIATLGSLRDSHTYTVVNNERGACRSFILDTKASYVASIRSVLWGKDHKAASATYTIFLDEETGILCYSDSDIKIKADFRGYDLDTMTAGLSQISDILQTVYGFSAVESYCDDTLAFDAVKCGDFVSMFYKSLDKALTQVAYQETRIVRLWKEVDISFGSVHIVSEDKRTGYTRGMIYCPTFDALIPFCCSRTTRLCLQRFIRDGVPSARITLGKGFPKLHFHQIVLRVGHINSVWEFKKLKLEYLKANKEIFGGVCDPTTVIIASNYIENFDDRENGSTNYLGFHGNPDNLLCMNARYFNMTSNKFSKHVYTTLYHEMCHAWVKTIYGTFWENDGEDGATLYGLSTELFGVQVRMHGKHFGEAVKLVADKTEFTFEQIFGYGLRSSLEEQEDLSSQAVYAVAECNAFDNGRGYRYKDFESTDVYRCASCGRVSGEETVCCGDLMVKIGHGTFAGRCPSCGNVEIYADNPPSHLWSAYMADVDRMLGIYTIKCSKCGYALIPCNLNMKAKAFNEALSDYAFAKKYCHHFYEVASGTLGKYNKWFRHTAECEVSMHEEEMPIITMVIKGEYFEEYYKVFFTAGLKQVYATLYRDYNSGARGYRIHRFRLQTDTSIEKFMSYFMTYLRKDFRTT